MKRQKIKSRKGIVYLVGAGPGDPGLLTVRGLALLRQADVVVYDALVNSVLLDEAPRAEKIYVGKNIRRKNSSGYVRQEKINDLLFRLASKGMKVVRLKGGDPFVFGRGAEEAAHLRMRKIPFEVVPGITAGIAVPAYAGIPVTDRRFSSLVTFVTAHSDEGRGQKLDWRSLAALKGTLVFFMSTRNLAAVTDSLQKNGLSSQTSAALIEWGTLPKQRVLAGTLGTIGLQARRAGVGPPSVLVLGEVARLRKILSWYRSGPLAGKTVMITRAKEQSAVLKQALEKEGARVLEFPCIRILPPKSASLIDRALKNLESFDWVFFTSPNGVSFVQDRLQDLEAGDSFAKVRIAAVGPATKKELEENGIRVDFVPSRFTTWEMARQFTRKHSVKGLRILLLRADIASSDLRHFLKAAGAVVKEITAYRTLPERSPKWKHALQDCVKNQKIDYVTFTSASTVRSFFRSIPRTLRSKLKNRCVSIGPATSEALSHFGLRPFREARVHTLQGLVVELLNRRRNPFKTV